MKTSAVLHNAAQAQTALQWLYRECKPWLVAGHQGGAKLTPAQIDMYRRALRMDLAPAEEYAP